MIRIKKEIHKLCEQVKSLASEYLGTHDFRSERERAVKFKEISNLNEKAVRFKKIHQAIKSGCSGLKW